jgi:hypothetical protein
VLYVPVKIVRFVDESFPGFVECHLSDALGQQHVFVDKVPIVTAADLGPESLYPQPGVIACEMSAQWTDEQGRELRRITTETPWGVESTSGETSFVVLAEQLLAE